MAKRVSTEDRMIDWFEVKEGPEARLMLAILSRITKRKEQPCVGKSENPKSKTAPPGARLGREGEPS